MGDSFSGKEAKALVLMGLCKVITDFSGNVRVMNNVREKLEHSDLNYNCVEHVLTLWCFTYSEFACTELLKYQHHNVMYGCIEKWRDKLYVQFCKLNNGDTLSQLHVYEHNSWMWIVKTIRRETTHRNQTTCARYTLVELI